MLTESIYRLIVSLRFSYLAMQGPDPGKNCGSRVAKSVTTITYAALEFALVGRDVGANSLWVLGKKTRSTMGPGRPGRGVS